MIAAASSRRHFLALSLAAAAACRHRQDASADPPPPPRPLPGEPADLIVLGGTIFTMDPAHPKVDAIAIANGRVTAVGSHAKSGDLIGSRTQVLDLRGGSATAGLTDGHAHLFGLGLSLAQVDLRGASSVEELVARLRKHAPPSGFIEGRGWDQNLWPNKAMPDHTPLTQAFPDRPVWLSRVDGHAGWGNRALLDAMGIGKTTAAPPGGEILRSADGTPTGVLIDAAMDLVSPPSLDAAQIRHHIRAAQDHALKRGLTGVHEMGISSEVDHVYRELAGLAGPDRLRLRVHAFASEDWFRRELTERAPDPIHSSSRYVLAGVKIYADGALGSRGAAMLAPYSDRAHHTGLMRHQPSSLQAMVQQALSGGWQIATHAIGDAANRLVLDAYEYALGKVGGSPARLRVEHCQIVDPTDIERFARLGVVASMQPTHATSDMGWVPDRIGTDRLAGAYAWQRFIQAGAHLCFGSDFPVELVDITHGLYAAMTRQDPQGQPRGGWLPDQRVDLQQSLRCFSAETAYAAAREDHLGQLKVGFRGDLTCFAEPIHELTARQLRDTPIQGTIVGGHAEYWRD